MAQEDRHNTIAECIAEIIRDNATDPYMAADVRVEDFSMTALPSYGIIVSPEEMLELPGTNERDDWVYTCLVGRVAHALHNEDKDRRLRFITDMRLLFHRKRIECDEGCYLYSSIEIGKVAIPQAWQKNNNSIAIVQVKTIVRESRERE